MHSAVGYVVAWSLSQAKPGVNIFETAESFITSFFVLTMFINITATSKCPQCLAPNSNGASSWNCIPNYISQLAQCQLEADHD